MALSSMERKLIQLLAEAYAFISDLRETGLRINNRLIVERTEGIEESVERRKAEFPSIFQRYYGAALRRADKNRRDRVQPPGKPSSGEDDGERKAIPRRKALEKKEEKGSDKKATPRGRKIKRKGTIKRTKPE